MSKIIETTGDVMVGYLTTDSVSLAMESAGSTGDLDDFLRSAGSESQIFAGPFPAAKNDGIHAVTIIVPDADGVVRDHPH